MTEREYAYRILCRIFLKNELCHEALREAADMPFVTRLVKGVTARYLTLTHLIEKQSGRSFEKIKPEIGIILIMGLYQGMYMNVPVSAAVNESVKLASKHGFAGLKGFVNGVLRGYFRAHADGGIAELESEPVGIRYSIPEWMAEKLGEEIGDKPGVGIILAGITDIPSKTYIYLLGEKDDGSAVVSKDEEPEIISVKEIPINRENSGSDLKLHGCHEIKNASSLTELEAFRTGRFIMQDISSQAACENLLKTVREKFAEDNSQSVRVLDLCAAPGGKSVHVYDGLKRLGYDIKEFVSCDVSAAKTALLDENFRRVKFEIKTVNNDALVYNKDFENRFDIVIADLPCSGLGVIGRKPDIKYKTKPEDITSLAKIQRDMLANSVKYLKDGGVMSYSTCTVAHEENEDNAAYASSELGLALKSELRLLPGADCDGFYQAVFIK